MRSTALVVLGLLFLPSQLFACYWDQDTLASEAHDKPDVVQAAVGRFPRNPPLYYKMRIDRETKELVKHPNNLDLYDDLAVANSRIGNDDKALLWIEMKRQWLGDMSGATTVDGKRDPLSEAAYRYYANAGTILLVKWMRKPGDQSLLKRSRELIARAIEINPNAHFGREPVQLKFIDWLLKSVGRAFSEYLGSASLNDDSDHMLDYATAKKNAEGLVGLIVLGAGWESVDIFEGLSREVEDRREHYGKLGYFVSLRVEKLESEGKKPLVAYEQVPVPLGEYDIDWIKSQYRKLSQEADRWQASRTAYMMTRLQKGDHPDTDPHFWDQYHESPAPTVEWSFRDVSPQKKGEYLMWTIFGTCGLVLVLVVYGVIRHFLKPRTNRLADT